jgi:hypothetical protein
MRAASIDDEKKKIHFTLRREDMAWPLAGLWNLLEDI